MLRSKDLTMIIYEKKIFNAYIDDFPFQPVCCAVKTLLMDAHPVCTRYQFNFANPQCMLPRSDQEDMFMILFYLFQSVALSVLSCFVTDEVGEYPT